MDKQFHWGSETSDGAVSTNTAITSTTLVLLRASRNKQAYLFSIFFSNLSMPLPATPFKSLVLRQNYANVIFFYCIFALMEISLLIRRLTPAVLRAIFAHYFGLDDLVHTPGYGFKHFFGLNFHMIL